MTKPNTTPIPQPMIRDAREPSSFSLDQAKNAADHLETKILDLIRQHKDEIGAGTSADRLPMAEIEPMLCVSYGVPSIKVEIEIDGEDMRAYIPISTLAYPFDTLENFPPHNNPRGGRCPEMVAAGVRDRAALAAALRALADNVAADPAPSQAPPTPAE